MTRPSRPTGKQEAALARWADYIDNPGAFAYDCFRDPETQSGHLELAPHQVDVMQRIAAGRDVTWRSGHGVGKTTTLAVLIIWWLCTRPRSKVPTTAPTWYQVKTILWSEIAKWFDRFRYAAALHLDKTKLYMKAYPDEWFAIGVASNRPENIEGYHASRLLYIVDEAKGVADRIFDAVDGALTEGGQRIYVSTPGGRAGKFYLSHHGRLADLFDVVHTNGETAPRVSRKWVEAKRLEWGEDSPIYIAKVRGEFPQEGDDVLYPLDWLDEAERAFLEADEAGNPLVPHASHLVIGCDVARFGFNKTIAVIGSSTRLDRLIAWERQPVTQTAGRLTSLVRDGAGEIATVGVDDTGLGGGVTDILRENGIPVVPILLGGAPNDREHFGNLKAEIAWHFRKALEENYQARQVGKPGAFAVLPHERLKGQLSSMRRRYTQKGQLMILDPDDPSVPATELAPGMKVSPDHAHAAILAHYTATEATAAAVSVVQPPTEDAFMAQRQRLSSYIFGGRGPGRNRALGR